MNSTNATEGVSRKPAVLLVDDNPVNLRAVVDSLETEDCELLTARSAKEALGHLGEAERIAFVLSDIKMPFVDGVELLRQLRQDERSRHIPVTLMTATYKDRSRAREVYEIGAVDYMELPLDPMVLRAKVRVFVELQRQRYALAAANRELAMLNRELESFAYAVAHDLRTPLRVMSAHSCMLQVDYAPKLNEEYRRHLNIISEAALEVNHMLDALIRLSGITRMPLRCGPMSLDKLAAKALATLRLAEPARHVEVVIQTGLNVWADANLVRLLLNNLLENAWKFSAKNPHARIEVGAEELPSGGRAFYVRDNGAGFNLAHASKLFTPFERLHRAEKFPGVGIGLSIVRRVAERHGGRLWAEGAPDKGAIFRFTLSP